MEQHELLDEARWRSVLSDASQELSDDSIACELLAFRLAGQYLPALLSARRPEDRQRVWNALWSYMTMAPDEGQALRAVQPGGRWADRGGSGGAGAFGRGGNVKGAWARSW